MDPSRFDRLTRRLGARTTRRAAVGTSLAGLALGGFDRIAMAQDPVPTTGADAAATPQTGEKPVFMFVETFASGRGEVNPAAGTPTTDGTPAPAGGASFLLTLAGHTGLTVYFSDRPDRVVGATATTAFLDTFDFSVSNPPNAALVGEFASGQGVVVLELLAPSFNPESGTLTYGAEVLDGYKGGNLDPVTREQVAERLPAEFGPAALFIDDCPDINACLRGEGFIAWIPGGPYGQCWQGLFKGGCEPCWYTRDQLDAVCNNAFPDRCEGDCYAYGWKF